MIALIIYLTFTSENSDETRHKNTQQAEIAAKERLAQNNKDLSRLAIKSDHLASNHLNKSKQETELDTHSYSDSTSNESIDDDDPLRVLPYPKDDHFK